MVTDRAHRKHARRFAEKFMSMIKSWSSAKPKPNIAARIHVGMAERMTAFTFTLGRPDAVGFGDEAEVSKLVQRAIEIAPQCDPMKGDLAVFDGPKILMFRRFDERLSMRAAIQAAREIASHILMNKKENHAKEAKGI